MECSHRFVALKHELRWFAVHKLQTSQTMTVCSFRNSHVSLVLICRLAIDQLHNYRLGTRKRAKFSSCLLDIHVHVMRAMTMSDGEHPGTYWILIKSDWVVLLWKNGGSKPTSCGCQSIMSGLQDIRKKLLCYFGIGEVESTHLVPARMQKAQVFVVLTCMRCI